MDVLLIRHANMAGDPQGYYSPPVQGCLSPQGEAQAAALARRLDGARIDAIYSSPLGRAVQTAQALALPRGLRMAILPWLVEWLPAPALQKGDPARFEETLKAAARLRPEESWKTAAGEGVFEMANRIVPGWLDLLARHGVRAGHGGYLLPDEAAQLRLAVVSHGATLGVLLSHILGIPMQPFPPLHLKETACATIEFVRRADVWYPALRLESA